MLRGLLKFATGSSSLPFDEGNFRITVQFSKSANVKRLPIAHTCFKSIEVPCYASFEDMRNKLTLAITHGSEGFGMA